MILLSLPKKITSYRGAPANHRYAVSNLGTLFESLRSDYGELHDDLSSVDGELRPFITVRINNEVVDEVDTQSTISSGSTVTLLNAVAGDNLIWDRSTTTSAIYSYLK